MTHKIKLKPTLCYALIVLSSHFVSTKSFADGAGFGISDSELKQACTLLKQEQKTTLDSLKKDLDSLRENIKNVSEENIKAITEKVKADEKAAVDSLTQLRELPNFKDIMLAEGQWKLEKMKAIAPLRDPDTGVSTDLAKQHEIVISFNEARKLNPLLVALDAQSVTNPNCGLSIGIKTNGPFNDPTHYQADLENPYYSCSFSIPTKVNGPDDDYADFYFLSNSSIPEFDISSFEGNGKPSENDVIQFFAKNADFATENANKLASLQNDFLHKIIEIENKSDEFKRNTPSACSALTPAPANPILMP